MKEFLVDFIDTVLVALCIMLLTLLVLTSDFVHVERTKKEEVASIAGYKIEREITIDYNKEAKKFVEEVVEWCNDIADSF